MTTGRGQQPNGIGWWAESIRLIIIVVAAGLGTVGANRVHPPATDRWTATMQNQFAQPMREEIAVLRKELAAINQNISAITLEIARLPKADFEHKVDLNTNFRIIHQSRDDLHGKCQCEP